MSTYTDRFVAERLPPCSEWPVMMYPDALTNGTNSLNLVSLLLDQSMDKPWADRPLFRSTDQTLSYREALSAVNQRVNLLRAQAGVQTGNRVLLRGNNSIGFALAWLAVVKAGLIAVPTMPLLRAKELGDIIDKARPAMAWCEASLCTELLLAQEHHPDLHTVLHFNSHNATNSVESLSAGFSSTATASATTGDDIALLAFTSGTTGVPKAVCHSHLDIWSACQAWPLEVLRAHMNDIVTGTPQLAFTFGLGGLLLFPMLAGASIFYPSPPLTPERMVQEMAQAQCTIFYTAPTFYRQMAAHIQQQPVPTLRISISAGEALPDATRQLWRQASGLEMLDGIGATEMFHIFISSPVAEFKPSSLGKVVAGYEALVVDPHGQELPRGRIGRLAVRGPTGCKYLDDERQRACVQGGWNFPGDAVLQDEYGYFFYQSRADDMIVSSGYNIGGPEVEDALLLHPAVAECAVIGKADAERGMVVQAFCVLQATTPASDALVKLLQDHVKQHLAPYKYPRVITFLPSLPRTATGKLQRFKLRDLNNQNRTFMHTVLLPEGWTAPKGYANGIAARGLQIYVGGQIGWNAAQQFESDDFVHQTRLALRNVLAVLQTAQAAPEHMVRMTWYITDRHMYQSRLKELGSVYREVMGQHYPAMTCIVVSGLVEERALVEVEVTAVIPDAD